MATRNGGKGTYRGPERRKLERRQKSDRREDVRWEPKKDDRRKNRGRRGDDKTFRLP